MKLRWFLTALVLLAVPSMGDFKFAVMSDMHIKGGGAFAKNLTAIVGEIDAASPDFVLVTGDQTELGYTDDYDLYRKLTEPLKMPVYNVAGNHETKWSNWGKAGISKFFGQDPYYSFDYGGIHFVGLDSTVWLEHNGFIDRSELTWLKNDLRKVGRKQPVVLFYHHSPGYLQNEPELLNAIRPYNVPLVIVGHAHVFKTWKKNGTIFQMTKGGMNDEGGFRLYEVSDSEIRGFTKLTGKPLKPDLTIPLKTVANPVRLIRPLPMAHIDGPIRIRASVRPLTGKVEYGIDDDYQPAARNRYGIYEATDYKDITPGWHTITIRVTDAAGVEWTDSVQARVGAGKEVWRAKVSGAVQRPVRVSGDRIYFGAWGGDVYCLDARTGKEIWRRDVGTDVISEIAVGDGNAYLGAADGRVIALDAGTGKPIWEYKTNGPIQASPVLGGGKVFVGSGDQAFYALDAKTGKFAWKFEMTRMTQELPIFMDDAVFFGAWDNTFYALNAKDGSVRWKTKIGEILYASPSNSNPATDGRHILVAAWTWHKEDPDLFCLDARTGEITWKRRSPSEKSMCGFNSPFIAGDRFYTAALNGDLFCLNVSDGSKVWRASIGKETYENSPVVANGRVYIGGVTGGLFCFDAATGQKKWEYSTGSGYLFASPTVWQDLVIAPSTDGWVTAITR